MVRKIRIIIIIAVIAAIAAGFYIYLEQPKPLEVQKKDLETTQLPSGFPSTFPSEMGSRILENYEVSTPDGRKQFTRTVTTAKPVEDRVKEFRRYFVELGWIEIENSKPDAYTTSSLLRKEDNTVLITGFSDPKKSEKTVSITLVESPK